MECAKGGFCVVLPARIAALIFICDCRVVIVGLCCCDVVVVVMLLLGCAVVMLWLLLRLLCIDLITSLK